MVVLHQMDDCDHPLHDVSLVQVAHLFLSFLDNGFQTRMGPILVQLSPQKNSVHGPKTDTFKKGKRFPVLEKTMTVDYVDLGHRLTVMSKLQTSTETGGVSGKSCPTNPIPVDFISRQEGKPLSDREVLQMTHVAHSMSEIDMKETSFVVVLNSVLRYAVTFALENTATISQTRVTDLVVSTSTTHR